MSTTPGRAGAASPSLDAAVGFALGPACGGAFSRKEARKDGPSLLWGKSPIAAVSTTPGRAGAASPSLGAAVGFTLGPARGGAFSQKEARKDGPSLLRSQSPIAAVSTTPGRAGAASPSLGAAVGFALGPACGGAFSRKDGPSLLRSQIPIAAVSTTPGRAGAASPSLDAAVGFALGPARGGAFSRKEARKDGPSPMLVIVVLVVFVVDSYCIVIVSSCGIGQLVVDVVGMDNGNNVDCGSIGWLRSGLPLLQLLHQYPLIPSSTQTIITT